MYYVFQYAHRANKTTLWYGQSGAPAIAAAHTLAQTYPSSPTFGGVKHLVESPGLLTGIAIEKWVNQAAYDSWASANATARNAYNTARNTYNAAHGITYYEIKVTDSQVLF